MRLIPPTIPTSAPPGEKQIFKKFSYDRRFNEWLVLHSLDVAHHQTNISGEVDFLIINPNYGILCAEVKSHQRIVCKNRQWYFGNKKKPEKSPFKQVKGTSFSLRDYLIDKNKEFEKIPWWHIVIFPRCKFIYDSPSWQPWEVIDKGGFRNFYRSLKYSFQCAKEHVVEKSKNKGDYKLTEDRIEEVLNILRPEFEISEASGSRTYEKDKEIREFTEEQFEALDHMRENKRVFFKGSAGTGKTFLAIEAAKRSSNIGRKVLLLCYNRGLCEWLRKETKGFHNVDIYNIDKLLISLGNDFNITEESEVGSNYFWEFTLPNTVLKSEALKDSLNKYDQIIIDEAQDLLKPPYLEIIDRLLIDGLQKGRWILFGDFTNQSIFNLYQQKQFFITPAQFEKYLDSSSSNYVLTKNCRNIQQIGEFYEEYIKLDPGYNTYLRTNIYGSKGAQLIECKSIEQKINLTKQIIKKLNKESIKRKVAILSVYDDTFLGRVRKELLEEEINVCSELNSFTKSTVYIGTVQSFKGLEADSIILRKGEKTDSREELNLFYVGCSRARDDLFVL